MRSFFLICTMVFMGATLVVLMLGLFGLAKGGALNQRYGNLLMRARVLCQALAVGSFVLFMLSDR